LTRCRADRARRAISRPLWPSLAHRSLWASRRALAHRSLPPKCIIYRRGTDEGTPHPDDRMGCAHPPGEGGEVAQRVSFGAMRAVLSPLPCSERALVCHYHTDAPTGAKRHRTAVSQGNQGKEAPRPLTADTWAASPNVQGWVESPCREAQSLDTYGTLPDRYEWGRFVMSKARMAQRASTGKSGRHPGAADAPQPGCRQRALSRPALTYRKPIESGLPEPRPINGPTYPLGPHSSGHHTDTSCPCPALKRRQRPQNPISGASVADASTLGRSRYACALQRQTNTPL